MNEKNFCLFLFVCLFCSVTFLDQKVGRGEALSHATSRVGRSSEESSGVAMLFRLNCLDYISENSKCTECNTRAEAVCVSL